MRDTSGREVSGARAQLAQSASSAGLPQGAWPSSPPPEARPRTHGGASGVQPPDQTDRGCWNVPSVVRHPPFNMNMASIVWSRPLEGHQGPLEDVAPEVAAKEWGPVRRAELEAVLPDKGQMQALRFRTCAVVGSSPEITLYKDGPEIDSHDAVFRANLAVTRHFEDHVGNRTTVRVVNPVESIARARSSANGGAFQGGDATIVIKTQDPPSIRDPSAEHAKFLREKQALLAKGLDTRDYLSRRHMMELCNLMFLQSGVTLGTPELKAIPVNFTESLRLFEASVRHGQWREWHPMGSAIPRFSQAHCSTGTVLLTYALLVCDKVTLYGFHVCDCTRTCTGTVKSFNHYWDTKATPQFSKMQQRYNAHMRYYHKLERACELDFRIRRKDHCDHIPDVR